MQQYHMGQIRNTYKCAQRLKDFLDSTDKIARISASSMDGMLCCFDGLLSNPQYWLNDGWEEAYFGRI